MSKTIRVPGQLLADAGRALYGEEWTGPLSRALGHNSPRTCQRWQEAARKGEDYQVGRTLLADVHALFSEGVRGLEKRAGDVRRAANELDRLLVADAKAH